MQTMRKEGGMTESNTKISFTCQQHEWERYKMPFMITWPNNSLVGEEHHLSKKWVYKCKHCDDLKEAE